MPVLLLLLLGLAVGIGGAMVFLIARRTHHRVLAPHRFGHVGPLPFNPVAHSFVGRPDCWVAIKSTNLQAVQNALGLHNPKPCTWIKGLLGDAKLFISPPVRGWILVIGSGLPDPTDDPDKAFRFLAPLSRKFGHVQCFSACRVVQHHAWVRAEKGKIVRAYAWAGKTVWKQGTRTAPERDLDLVCRDYDWSEDYLSNTSESVLANVDKVPALAARWSLDPGAFDDFFLEQVCGVAGEPSLRF